jgi:hypothetical protein
VAELQLWRRPGGGAQLVGDDLCHGGTRQVDLLAGKEGGDSEQPYLMVQMVREGPTKVGGGGRSWFPPRVSVQQPQRSSGDPRASSSDDVRSLTSWRPSIVAKNIKTVESMRSSLVGFGVYGHRFIGVVLLARSQGGL